MSKVAFQGEAIKLMGQFPKTGTQAPEFKLCGVDLNEITLETLKGKKTVLNIFPSVDTPVCAASVRTFNEKVTEVENAAVVCISADLPFAMARFCGAEGIENVQSASFFRSPEFAEAYGVKLAEGPLAGLATRAIVVLDEESLIIHSELISEITDLPNYDAAMAALR